MPNSGCLYTLGPKGSDSERAAKAIPHDTIVLVSSFREAFVRGIATKSDVLCPAGYRKLEGGVVSETWVDLHFEFAASFGTITPFLAELMPLGIYEKSKYNHDTLCTHPATTKIAELFLDRKLDLLPVDSKPLIPDVFVRSSARYALHSHIPAFTSAYESQGIRTLAVLSGASTSMIWVWYQQ